MSTNYTLKRIKSERRANPYCDSSKTTAARFTITTDNGSVTRTVDVEW